MKLKLVQKRLYLKMGEKLIKFVGMFRKGTNLNLLMIAWLCLKGGPINLLWGIWRKPALNGMEWMKETGPTLIYLEVPSTISKMQMDILCKVCAPSIIIVVVFYWLRPAFLPKRELKVASYLSWPVEEGEEATGVEAQGRIKFCLLVFKCPAMVLLPSPLLMTVGGNIGRKFPFPVLLSKSKQLSTYAAVWCSMGKTGRCNMGWVFFPLWSKEQLACELGSVSGPYPMDTKACG